MADEDPMAFLNAQRGKLAAMAQAAEEQAAIAATVAGVRNRMQAIENLAQTSAAEDAPVIFEEMDVDAWKRKIAALSQPVTSQNAARVSQIPSFAAQQPKRGQSYQPSHRTTSTSRSSKPPGNSNSYQPSSNYSPTKFAAAPHRQAPTSNSSASPGPALCMTCFDTHCKCPKGGAAQAGGKPQLCTKCFDIPCICR
jgi:hypothetical protein